MRTITLASGIVLLFILNGKAQPNSDLAKEVFEKSVLPKGNRAPISNFTGVVWLYPIAVDSLASWSIAKVSFEPGSYSRWHTHSGKQVLVITEGTGYLKENGKPVRYLKKGDVVTIQPETKHWHGATPQSSFVQIVMMPELEKGVVTWMERVTEEEYREGK